MIKTGLLFLLAGLTFAQSAAPVQNHEMRMPLEFEANRGQFAPEVLFLARAPEHFIYLTRQGLTLGLNSSSQGGTALQMKLVNAAVGAEVAPEGRMPGVSNYFIGNNPAQWQREAPHYSRIRYRSVWAGIDLVFHGREQALEYDFTVAPGADPSAIRLLYGNASDLRLDAAGNLVIEMPAGKVIQHAPEIYQEVNGSRRTVRGSFQLVANHEVQFRLGPYDRRRTLVIDPTVTYSTFIAGTGYLSAGPNAVDSSGNSYVVGTVSSPDFPLVNPIKPMSGATGLFHSSDQGNSWGSANSNIGNAKVNALASDPGNPQAAYAATSRGVFKTTNSGSSWALEGSSLPVDAATCVAVDPLTPATVYVCLPEGLYKSTDSGSTWKKLPNAGVPTVAAVDFQREGAIWLGYAFDDPVISLDGGNSFFQVNLGKIAATSIAIDPTNSNNVFIGATSIGLFVTNNSGISFSQVIAGLTPAAGEAVTVNAIAIDKNNAQRILVGTSNGAYLSFSGGANFQATQGIGVRKVLSVLFDPNNDSITLAGVAGGGVYVSANGGQNWNPTGPANLDVNALAMSSDEKNTWAGLYSGTNAFVTKINAAGTAVVYSTYLGGGGTTLGYGLAVDSVGHAFVCGSTDAPDFPTQNAYQAKIGGGIDFFISRLSASGSSLDDSTFFGGHADDTCYGLALDAGGNVYVGGTTILVTGGNSDFPSTAGSFSNVSLGGQDCVVAKFDSQLQSLSYSTFLGGNDADTCYNIAVDSSGSAYVVGATFSFNFPVTQTPYGGTAAAPSDTNTPAFVAKFKPDGSRLVYSALLGGAKGLTQLNQIAVDQTGRAFVTGVTQASDYPLTSNAISTTIGSNSKTVVAAISADGSKLVYSTFLSSSGNDAGNSLALDSSGNAWITGNAGPSFPVTSDALPHTPAASTNTPFLAEVDATGSHLLHATYLAGNAGGAAGGVALGADGSVFVSGTTRSADFTLTGTPFQTSQSADYRLYLMRLAFGSSGGGAGAPTITAVQNGASFQNGFAPGGWMTIQGSNLSTVTDTWDQTISNSQLPTVLDGVKVSVGGQPAYVAFVSPGQINVVAPNVAPGPVSVTVTNAAGVSAAFTATAQTDQPAFFLVNGTYAVATRPDFSVALKNGTIPGVTTVAAKPGDVIILWGTGFGPTNPPAPSGVEVPAGAYPTGPVTVTVGGQPATVIGAALAPSFAALYQVAIYIPTSLADGDYPVVATVGGASSPATCLISVAH